MSDTEYRARWNLGPKPEPVHVRMTVRVPRRDAVGLAAAVLVSGLLLRYWTHH